MVRRSTEPVGRLGRARRPDDIPRGSGLFLLLVAPRHREHFLGDLLEEYRGHVLPGSHPAAARRWWWTQLVRGSLVALFHRVYNLLHDHGQSVGTAGFGGARHEDSNRSWDVDGLWRDFKYSLRRLAGSPGFTLVALVSLALGIGANTAIFSLVNAVLVRRPPMTDPGALVEIYAHQDNDALQWLPVSWADLDDIAALDVFQGVTGWEVFFASTQVSGRSQPILGELVAGNLFDVLGVGMALGRAFLPEEDALPDHDPVVIISYAYWQNRFGRDPGVLGQTIRLNGRPFTIVGVAPPRFTGTIPAMAMQVWVPRIMADQVAIFAEESSRLESRGPQSAFLRGRLRSGTTPAQAQSALDGLMTSLKEQFPEAWDGYDFRILPTSDVAIHPQVDRALLPVAGLLMTVVGLVLLIACVNLASFLLARGADRSKEVALRLALGAQRIQLIRQLLVETTLLALLGGVVGVTLAQWTLNLAMRFRPPLLIPISLDVGIDRTVLLFALAASMATGLLFGLVPALWSTRPDLGPTLKDRAGSVSNGPAASRLRGGWSWRR